ncbi:MAG: hypothetical protein ACK55I_21050, partial [bacterium]
DYIKRGTEMKQVVLGFGNWGNPHDSIIKGHRRTKTNSFSYFMLLCDADLKNFITRTLGFIFI